MAQLPEDNAKLLVEGSLAGGPLHPGQARLELQSRSRCFTMFTAAQEALGDLLSSSRDLTGLLTLLPSHGPRGLTVCGTPPAQPSPPQKAASSALMAPVSLLLA